MTKLVDYLNMVCSGTGQSTFYNTREEQEHALLNTHMTMFMDNRRLYLLSAALPITDKSRQIILKNILSNGKDCKDSVLESNVINMAVEDLQFNRVLNMFMDLREQKVNNSRTRKLGKLIWEMVDEFRAIKYRDKVRVVLRHCHIPEGTNPTKAEIHRWIFGPYHKRQRAELQASDIQYNEKIRSRILAATQYEKVFDLPYDIARDIAVNVYKKDATEFEREFAGKDGTKGKGQVTKKESMRARQKTKDTSIDFNRFTIFELFMHGYKNPTDRDEILPVIKQKAKKIAEGLNFPGKVALVIDNSISTLGSLERQFQPIAMISAIATICQASDSDVKAFYVSKPKDGDEDWLKASGSTNLRKQLVDALVTRPDLVLILSDGYENVCSGSVNQILNSKAVIDSKITVMHINPVTAAESSENTRTLSDRAMTFSVSSPEQLPMITLMALASQDPGLLEPMFSEVERNLRLGDYKAAKLATRIANVPVLA